MTIEPITSPALSERATRYIVTNGCMPPASNAEATAELLRARDISAPDVLWAWEDTLRQARAAYLATSGCASAPGQCRYGQKGPLLKLPGQVRFSIADAMVRGLAPPTLEHEGTRLVLFGEAGYAGFLYLDAKGRVYATSGQPNAPYYRLAASPWVHVERVILRALAQAAPASLRCEGAIADRLANALGVPLAAEASDEVDALWADHRVVMREQAGAETLVTLLEPAASSGMDVLRALAELGGRARLLASLPEVDDQPAATAPLLETPPPPRVRLWTFGGVEGWIAAAPGRDGGAALVAIEGRETRSRHLLVDRQGARSTRHVRLDEETLPSAWSLSARARAYLLAAQARRDPINIPRGDELGQLLARWGLPTYPALEEANAAWSGLTWGEEPPTVIGTFAELLSFYPDPLTPVRPRAPGDARDLGLTWEGRELVTIGSSAGTSMYLDHDGAVIEHDAEGDQLFRSAGSLRTRIEFEAALAHVTGTLGHTLEAALAGSVGADVARRAGLPPVPEASDDVRAWWMGEHASVNELYSPVDGQRITAIFADDEALLEELQQLVGDAP
jgi:hypothetical protein